MTSDRSSRDLLALFVRRYGSAFGFAILCVYFSAATEHHTFTQAANLLNIADQVSVNLILAVGMTFVIVSGGIDLSVGSVLALGGTVVGGVLAHGLSLGPVNLAPLPPTAALTAAAIAIALGVGAACGAFSGLAITRFKLHAFLVTLAMMLIARNVANIYVGGGRFGNLPDAFTSLGRGRFGPVPHTAVLAAAIVLVGAFVLRRTAFGRRLYAIGGNEEAARLSGIPVARTKLIVYTACGMLAALGGVVSASTLGAGDPTTGYYGELDAIAAVVLGGASLSGGVGSIGGTVLGALLIGVLNNGLALMHEDEFRQGLIRGVVILAAVILDQLTKRKAG